MSRSLKKLLCFACTAVILFSFSGCVDQSGTEENAVSGESMAIATTSVAICEILDALDYDNVIGVPETESELPERYSGATTIGASMTPDYEILKSLAPDLVLSPQTLESTLAEDYSAAGINSAFLDLSSIEGMYRAITSLGELIGRETEAQALVDEYNAYMENYASDSGETVSIMLLMTFPDGFYLVSTENSYVGNLIKLAGGTNVYDSNTDGDENGFVSINPEDMIQRNPDKILVYAHYSEESAFAYMQEEFETNDTWQYYDAVVNGEIYYLPSEYFGMSATLDWTDALDYLKPILYGE